MKKIAMFFTAVLLLTTDLLAQPYIHTRALKDSYFPYVWINPDDETIVGFDYSLDYYGHGPYNIGVLTAKYFYTEEEIPVYGVAAGLFCIGNSEWDYPNLVLDTSWDNAFEYFTLFKPAVDTVMLTPISDSLVFHLRDTPIAYYMDMGPENHDYYSPMIIPVYEQYFDSVYYVTDSFYVGWTRRSAKTQYLDTVTNIVYRYTSWPVKPFAFAQIPELGTGDRLVLRYDYSSLPTEWQGQPIDYGPEWYYLPHNSLDVLPIFFIFPIIAPPDTTGTGDDSLAVQVALVDRLVAVHPNPATEQVRVLSSFGMERLTAYDAAGRKVHEQSASGFSTTLEVTGWPAGTYILHIQTPMGVSTKRLVVAR